MAKERMAKDPGAKIRAKEATARYRKTEHGKNKIRAKQHSKEYRVAANAYQREYSKRKDVKIKLCIKRANYSTRNMLKEKARHVANYAKKSGELIVPHYCDWCGYPGYPDNPLEIHHWRGYDPAHWLDVKFVHEKCHDECENVTPERWPL
jgi:predicted Zn-ribbon and HTH transcriptional regulator